MLFVPTDLYFCFWSYKFHLVFFKRFSPAALVISVFPGLQLLTASPVLFVPFSCASSLVVYRKTISPTFLSYFRTAASTVAFQGYLFSGALLQHQ